MHLAIQVRLAGSAVKRQGRVEVRYNGQWGTICDDYWDLSEAHVICRMLNYSGAEFAPRRALFGPGRWYFPIWLDSVKCRGDESTIAACRHDGWRQHDCYHSEDASVVCWSESTPAYEGMDSRVKLTCPYAIIRIPLNNELDVLEKSQSGSKALFNYSGHAW